MKKLFLEDESPRFHLSGPRLSPSVEMARWLLESRGHTYQESVDHHRIWGAGSWPDNLLKFQHPAASVSGIGSFLVALEGFTRPHDSLWVPRASDSTTLSSIRSLERVILKPVMQLFFYCLRDDKHLVSRYLVPQSPLQLLRTDYWFWRSRLSKQYNLDQFNPDECIRQLKLDFTRLGISRSIQSDASPDTFTIALSSIASMLLMPPECESWLPPLQSVTEFYRQTVQQFRELEVSKLILKIYAEHRKPKGLDTELPQSPAAPPQKKSPILPQLIGKFVFKHSRQLLRMSKPLRLGNTVFVAHWSQVAEVLQKDNDFLIPTQSRDRIEDVSGPFILGLNRSPALLQQREWIYTSLKSADSQGFEKLVTESSHEILKNAASRDGTVDVVNGYSRLVAARSASHYFGIAGPSEPSLMKAVRSIFHHAFLNVSDDSLVRQRGIESGKLFKSWVIEEIQKRRFFGNLGGDVLGHLVRQVTPNNDHSVSWMLAGLFIGSVDTTSTVVCNIIKEALLDNSLLRSMREDVDHPQRFLGWCWEALRRRPHNPALVRVARTNTTLGGRDILAGSRMILMTQAAMFDPQAFENPEEMMPDRPMDRYLHFGRDLHQCSGKCLSEIQIPALVRALVKYSFKQKSNIQLCGPFPDSLVVSLSHRSTR